MSRRGSYIGGHKVIGPRSIHSADTLKGRFPRPLNPEQILLKKERLEKQKKVAEKSARLQRDRGAGEAARKAKRELKRQLPTAMPRRPRGPPEKIAEREEAIVRRRAVQDAKMAKIEVVHRKRIRKIDPRPEEVESSDSLIFTPGEINALKRHLTGYEKLVAGKVLANTKARRHFLDVSSGRARAETVHEIAFIKYRRWQAEEHANGSAGAVLESSIGERVYPDHVWEKLKHARWRLPSGSC